MNSCAPPYFTIITPVYNAAPFLENTVQCILRQSFSDFELILIDDQSQDNSWDLCQKFSALDSRVKCFRTPQNGGASAARNVGLSHVNGQFLIFIDADDEVPQDYLKNSMVTPKIMIVIVSSLVSKKYILMVRAN